MLIIFFYNENKISKRIKTYFLFLIFSSLLFIVFSGERSSIVMLIISLFLAALMINGYKNIKLLFIFSFILSFIAIILIKPNIYNRLITQTFYLQVYSLEKNKIYFFSKTHEAHYQTALNIFLDKQYLVLEINRFDFFVVKISILTILLNSMKVREKDKVRAAQLTHIIFICKFYLKMV